MLKLWKYQPPSDTQDVHALAKAINVNPALAEVLIQRGVTNFEEAKQFFRPQLEDLHDPFLMKDMDRAVQRLIQAWDNDEHILIYGDYDVDGTTSVALVHSFLESIGLNVTYYIPDRYKEGYGLSYQGIDYAHDNDMSLIITLDCGIKAIEKVTYANEKGIDIVICDHHRPGVTLPDAVAVLDPKRADCEYPFKELCGCGVGFKLMQALSIKKGIDQSHILEYLDLVAVAIGADIVPITGENRVLCYYGLECVNSDPRLGIKKILQVAQFDKKMTVMDLVFIIAPRINAAGRIETGNRAVELLCCQDHEQAEELVALINNLNAQRKELDQEITAEALCIIGDNPWYEKAKSTVVHSDNWHKGVVGIVASRIIEQHYKPTIVLTESNGMLTGSARSVKHFDVHDAIASCEDILVNFGGHKYAAGLTIKKDDIDDFKQRFESYVASNIGEESMHPEIIINTELQFDMITDRFYNILSQMGPFGPKNMRPVFVSKNCHNAGEYRLLKDAHLKLYLGQAGNEKKLAAIGFNMKDKWEVVTSGKPFDMVYNIDENIWQNKASIQLIIKDLKPSE